MYTLFGKTNIAIHYEHICFGYKEMGSKPIHLGDTMPSITATLLGVAPHSALCFGPLELCFGLAWMANEVFWSRHIQSYTL